MNLLINGLFGAFVMLAVIVTTPNWREWRRLLLFFALLGIFHTGLFIATNRIER